MTKNGFKIKVGKRRSMIIKTLKEQGIYSAEMYMQAQLAAQLIERADQLFSEIMDEGHSAVLNTTSREGAGREKVSALEKLYLEYVDRAQRAIKALGANTDSKDHREEGTDTYSSFMASMGEDGTSEG